MVLFQQAVSKCPKKYVLIKSPQQKCDFSDLHITINETNLEQIGKDCNEQNANKTNSRSIRSSIVARGEVYQPYNIL